MKRICNAFLFLLLFAMLSVKVQASCCNAGFSNPKIPSSAKNWYRFIMHDSAAADIQSVHWSFGDSTYSDQRTPYHAYYASGDYSVTLTVIKKPINGIQKSCTETHILSVTYACADFTFSTSNLSAAFLQTRIFDSTSFRTRARSYTWVFGDGQLSNELNPTHTYAAAGTYNVCLYQNKLNASAIGAYCSSCHTVVVKDTTPPECRSDFSYSLTDSLVFLYSNSTIGDSYWWIQQDTAAHTWGNNAAIALSAKDSFTICHRQYTDSIVGPNSAYCEECSIISHSVDTLPTHCNSDFNYTVTGNTVYAYSNSNTDSANYFGNAWSISNQIFITDTVSVSYVFTSPGVKRICQSRVVISNDSMYADTCTTCKDIMIEAADVTIHPNPAVYQINVQSNDEMISSIHLYDINGSLMKNVSGINVKQYNLDISDLVSGIYYVSSVLTDGRVNKTKIIIQ